MYNLLMEWRSFGDGIVYPLPRQDEDTESLLSSERWERWGERAQPYDERESSSYDELWVHAMPASSRAGLPTYVWFPLVQLPIGLLESDNVQFSLFTYKTVQYFQYNWGTDAACGAYDCSPMYRVRLISYCTAAYYNNKRLYTLYIETRPYIKDFKYKTFSMESQTSSLGILLITLAFEFRIQPSAFAIFYLTVVCNFINPMWPFTVVSVLMTVKYSKSEKDAIWKVQYSKTRRIRKLRLIVIVVSKPARVWVAGSWRLLHKGGPGSVSL